MDKSITLGERRVGDDVRRGNAPAVFKKIQHPVELGTATVNNIGGNGSIAGTTRGFDDSADTAGRIPKDAVEFFDFEQPRGAPFWFNIEPVRFFVPDMSR